MIVVDMLTVGLLIGSVIPLLVALVTKLRASSTVKAVANLVLSFAGGALGFLATREGSGTWQEVVAAGLATWIVSGVAFHNLWKPAGATDAVAATTARTGIG